MAIGTPYHLGSAAPTGSVTTTAVTAGQASGSGDAIIVCTATTGLTASVTGITDTKSNAYSLVQRYAAGSYTVECWIAQGAAALTTSDTVTASWSGAGTTHRMDVIGCAGVATSSAADPSGIATASSAGSTSPSTGATGTLAQSGELAIAVFAAGSAAASISWGNSYTSVASVQAGSTEYLFTGYKSLSSTAGTTASGTITSAPWTAMVVTFQPVSSAGPYVWYDGTYDGWQALQATVPDPAMFAYGPAWTTAQLATLPPDTIQMPLDDTGGHPHSTTVIDVENGDVTTASAIANWINSRLALPGGYASNRPTVYLNTSGSYYLNAPDDVITPLKTTYGLHLGQDYDLWTANRTGSQPAAPIYTLGVPCVATQYASYAQTGSQYDINIAFDATWVTAFGGSTGSAVTADAGVGAAAGVITQVTTTPVTPPPPGAPGVAGIPGYVRIVVQCGFSPVAPVAVLGSFILDDPVYGLLDGGTLADDITWTDISAYVRSGSISRPSTRTMGPLLTYQAGTCSVVLANGDGRFDPDNTASPYAGGIRPMVPVQILAVWDAVSYPLFFGFTDNFADDGVNYGGRYAEITLWATDGFKVLQGITLPTLATAVGAGEDTGARVRRLLNAASWYTGQRNVDTGDSDLQGTTYGTTPLDVIQAAVESEAGEFWQDASGNAVFRNRHAIFTRDQSAQVQGIYGDSAGTPHGGNWLVSPDSDFAGGSTGNWTGAGNCSISAATISSQTVLVLTSAATGNMQAASCTAAAILTKGMQVAPELLLTVSAQFRTASVAEMCAAGAGFYDQTGASLGAVYATATVTDTSSGLTTCEGLVTAPADAAYARLVVQVQGTAGASEIHYVTNCYIAPATVPAAYTELPYTSATRACDDTIMANDVQATLDGTNYVEVSDQASIALSLFPRTYQSDTLLLLTTAELTQWAEWVLLVSKDSELRFDQITVNPLRDADDLWPQILGREIGDRVQVWRRPPGSVPVARDCFIRGMQHDFDASGQTWQTQFTLQDAARYTGFLLLDDSLFGQLDVAALAY